MGEVERGGAGGVVEAQSPADLPYPREAVDGLAQLAAQQAELTATLQPADEEAGMAVAVDLRRQRFELASRGLQVPLLEPGAGGVEA